MISYTLFFSKRTSNFRSRLKRGGCSFLCLEPETSCRISENQHERNQETQQKERCEKNEPKQNKKREKKERIVFFTDYTKRIRIKR